MSMSSGGNAIRSVCVYCASSNECPEDYFEAARQLGKHLAENGIEILYGGGKAGLMGQLADSALANNGRVIGIIPQFMIEAEWGHQDITELRIVDDIHQRKRTLLESSDGIVALPGGCGTLEELLEAITWRRLGLHENPIVIVNTRDFFDPCVDLLERCIQEQFMEPKHRNIWQVVASPGDVPKALRDFPT